MKLFEIEENNKKYSLEFGWDSNQHSFFMLVRDGGIGSAGSLVHSPYVGSSLVGSPLGEPYPEIHSFSSTCSNALAEIGLLDYELGDDLKLGLVNDKNAAESLRLGDRFIPDPTPVPIIPVRLYQGRNNGG